MNKQTKTLVYFFRLGILLRQILIRRNLFYFNADNYWRKSRKQQSERQRGKEAVEQLLRKYWKEGNDFSQELKALAGAQQPWWRSGDGTARTVRVPSLCKQLALATGDGLFFLNRKESQTANPVSHLKEFGHHLFMPFFSSNNDNNHHHQQRGNNSSIFFQISPKIKIAKICVALNHEVQASSCSRRVIHVWLFILRMFLSWQSSL